MEGQKQSEDRRKHLREPIIVFKVTEENEQEHLFGYAKNVSRGGLFIASINPREPGEQFYIIFQIPNTEVTIKCRCEVLWTRGYDPKSKLEPGYGIKFLDLAEQIAEAIDAWVSKGKIK